jgi:hypothetical protein
MNRACLPNNQNKHENYPMRALPQRRDKLSGRLKTIFFRINKIILGPLLLLAVLLARGQEYVPLLDTNKVWNIFNDRVYFGYTYPYYLEVCETDSSRFKIKQEQHSQYIVELGYLYEDTAARKVFYINRQKDEVLLYDFSLVKGDVFEYMLVTNVDSIALLDGTYRKRIEFEDGYDSYWIEGIGSLFGGLLRDDLNYLKHLTEAWLLCYYEKDSLLYMNEKFDSCDYSFTEINTENLKQSNSPSVYPNPFNHNISISFDNQISGALHEVIIKTMDGRIVFYESLHSENSLDLSFLGKGIYLLTVSNREFIHTTKIIKL